MRKVYLLMMLLCLVAKGYGATYHNKPGLVISSAANWGTGALGTGTAPSNFTTAGDVFILDNVPASPALGASISFGTNVTLNISTTTVSTGSNAFGLTFAGTNSTLTVLSGNTLNFTGTGTLSFTGGSFFNINSGGTVNMGTALLSGLAAATTVTNNGLFKTANTSALPIPQNRAWDGNGIIEFYASGNQTIPQNSTQYYCNIQTSGSGIKTTGGAVELSNGSSLTIGAGTTFSQGGALTIGGNWTNNGSYIGSSGAAGNVTFNSSTAGRTLSGNMTGTNAFGNNVTFASATGSWTFNNSAEIGNNLVENNGTITGPSGTLTVGGNFRIDVAYNHNGGTVVLNSAAGQNINNAASLTFNNLTINSGVGAQMVGNNVTVNNTLTFTSGKLSIGAFTLTLNGTAPGMSATNSLVGSASSALVIGSSSSLGSIFFDQTTAGTSNALGILTINGTGSATLGNALNVGSTLNLFNGTFSNSTFLTLAAGSTINRDNGTLSALPTWSGAGNLIYTTGGPNATAVTTGNEWPATFTGTLTINKTGATITLNEAKALTGNLTLSNGTLDASTSNYDLSLTGNWTNNGVFVPRSGTVTFSGSSAQNINGSTPTTFNALTINNTSGTTLASVDTRVNGQLTLTAGRLTLGTYNLTFGPAATISGASSSAMINQNSTGQVRKEFSAAGSFTYPIGEGGNYTPATLSFMGGTFGAGAYASVRVTGAKHPNNGSATDYINRYWTVNLSSISSPTYSATATYVTGDVTGTESNISMGRYAGALPWVRDAATNAATHTLSSGIATGPTEFSGILSAPPTATVTATPGTICAGGTATLSVSGTGDAPLTYSWAPSTGLSATTGTSVTSTLPTAGTITYTVTVTDVNGFSNTATTTVTVTAAPAITGSSTVCGGSSVTLSGTIPGGTWASSNALTATAGIATGVITGTATPGTTTISYAVTGCPVATKIMTVLATPVAITGTLNTCEGSTTTLTDATTGGTWSSSTPGVATIGSTTGIATGIAAGTTTITYSKSGCSATAIVTVDAAPAAITGTFALCGGTSTTLTYPSSPGGTWSSTNTGVAGIGSSTGIVSASAAGTSTIRYALSATCRASGVMTVTLGPAAIGGIASVCVGNNTTLSNATPGGSWNTSDGAIATVVAGVVHGVAQGTAIISYSLPTGCLRTVVVTVNPLPSPIAGSASVCPGTTSTLTSTPTGGTWTTSNGSIVGVGATTGIIAGVNIGTTNISYTLPTGCKTGIAATVNALPSTISGTMSVCKGSTTALSNPSAGGTWTSSNWAIGTIDASSGVAAGIAPGTATITYSVGTGCYRAITLTVNPLPTTISGSPTVCEGSSIAVSSTPNTGTWSSSNTAAATAITVIGGTGLVTGVTTGTMIITYVLPTGCIQTTEMTVNPLPSATLGALTLCPGGGTTTLSNSTPGGAWGSSNLSVATVDAAGVVTGNISGTAIISYTLPLASGGCSRTSVVTVYPTPAAIAGSSTVCEGANVTLSDASAGGTWSITGTPGIASVNITTGVVTGILTGTTTVAYTVTTGCKATKVMTVIPAPAAISGSTLICVGSSEILTSATPGGVWQSSTPTIAQIGSGTGIVTAIGAGTATISYTLVPTTGCRSTAIVTVNGAPGLITGVLSGCEGTTNTLSSSTIGGTWTSSNPAVAFVSTSGVVSNLMAGTSLISYTLGTGCQRVVTVTVNPLPAPITGPTRVCESQSTTLSSATAGGTWMAGNSNAVVGLTNHILTGLIAGTSTITYTLPTGCKATMAITIDQLPAAITGIPSLCPSSTTTLSSTTPGGTWSSSNPFAATVVPATGVVSATAPGSTSILYTISNGCFVSQTVTVNTLPTAIGGTLSVCTGQTTALNNSTGGGVWSSGSTGVATVTPTTAIVSGLTAGTTTISYIVGTGCIRTAVVTVSASPAAIAGAPSVCAGLTTTLTNSTTGGTWSNSTPGYATVGILTGVFNGVVTGTTTITYKLPNGCTSTAPMEVLQTPGVITGSNRVCEGSSITLGNAISAGTWTNSPSTTAIIGSSSGELTGSIAGTTMVTYTLITGCQKTATITVNPVPAPITGSTAVCPGSTSTLSNATPGGNWTPVVGTGAVMALNVLHGTSPGTTSISYTLPTGCRSTAIATVSPSPNILGTPVVCLGQSSTLTGSIPGGTWASSSPLIASVNASGIVDGYINGYTTITYTAPSGCIKTVVVAVSPTPAPIISAPTVCKGSTTNATTATAGGTWSSSNPLTAFIASGSGIITGMDTGTTNITYTSTSGCHRVTTISVTPLPAPITGPSAMCFGTTTTLTNDSLGGTWSSSYYPYAPINATTGELTAAAGSGTYTITYQLPTGCKSTKAITFNPAPAAITGSANICQGTTVTLGNSTPGGSWSSSTPLIASVPTTPGHVSGLSLGTSTITYKLSSGCLRTTTVTVNPIPDAITGTTMFCGGTTTTLSNTTPGGTWSSSNTSIATASSSTGIITGMSGGTALITYKLPTGCISMSIITVNAAPSTIGGATHICDGSTTILTNTQPGGIWTSSNPAIALVNTVGNVSGITIGTATITYALTTGCLKTINVTVQPTPAAIAGTMSVCEGSTTILSSTPAGGAWSSGHPSVATVGGPGIVTGISGGTAIMSYSLSTGCFRTQTVTVNTVPAAILGTGGLCVGSSLTLANATPGGTWASTSTATATIGAADGIVTGVSNGTVQISYTLPSGCAATSIVTVYAMPTAITGVMNICAGTTSSLTNATTGGTWTSSSTPIATVGSTTGVVTAIVPGISIITYMLPFGCRSTATVTVSPFAAPIAGITNICAGTTSTLSNITPGGTWSSSNLAIASVDVSSGIVTGVSAGSTIITYTTSSGCIMTTMMLVTPIPSAITGLTVMCAGSSITLSNSVGGGLWTSGDASIATAIGIGAITGVSPGTANITYSLGACSTSTVVTVNPAPPAIGGFTSVCTQMTTLLTNSTAGGTWSSSNPAVAPIDATGTVSGLNAGTSMVTYTLTAGCYATATIVVNTAPHPVINTHPNADLCSNTQFQNIGTSMGMSAGVTYTWNALNATINFISSDRRNCLISFPTPGTSLITLRSQVTATGCIVTDSLITNVTTGVSPTPSIVYYAPHLVCSDYTADSYQWGYDDIASLDSTKYAGEINQDLLVPTLDLANKAYWVLTMHQGCMQKTYYNKPTAVNGIARNITFVNLYPNPANTNITIEAGSEDIEVKLFDMLGKNLFSTTLERGKGNIDVSKLAAGTYSAVLFSNGEKVAVKTFVKN